MTEKRLSEIERLNKMRQDFVANVSHELRTPLTVIHGYIDTLLSIYEKDPQLSQIFTQILGQTQRMEAIVSDLLLLAKIENENPVAINKIVDAPNLIARILEDAQNLSNGDHEFTTDIDPELMLLGDQHELRSAFSNIVVNAVKYTKPSGHIKISWYKKRNKAHFEVKDTGIGIPEKAIARVTERFYRVDKGRSRQSGGTGLGLAIVKHVLLRHQAELKINSVINEGSTFICVFPKERMA